MALELPTTPSRASPLAAVASAVPRGLKTLLSALFAVICFSVRSAVAIETTVKTPAAAAASLATSVASLALSGDVLKWGGLAAAGFVVHLFSDKEDPHAKWSATDTMRTAPAAPPPQQAPAPVEATAESEDTVFVSDLQQRMMQLAEERARAEQEQSEEPPKSDDSSDDWGTGNTAVLEPPRPSEPPAPIDDASMESVPFPEGFPLRDMDDEEVAPAVDADKIAMLNRMMGLE